MKFVFDKDSFQKELNNAVKFTSSQLSSLPSLQGVFLELKEKKITIRSTNLNDFYSSSITVNSDDSFTTVFDAKKVLEFLNILSSGELTISLEKSGLLITQGLTQGEFNLFQLDDYPTFPEIQQTEEIILTDKMIELLPSVLFSASKDDSRPVLTGILIELKNEEVCFITTDGFRLSVGNYHTNNKNTEWSLIASSRFIQELLTLRSGKELRLKYSRDNKVFSCEFDHMVLLSRVIEGDFPPYQKVLPIKHTTSIIIETQSFIKNIKAASIFAREQANIIIFDIQKKIITIKPKGQKGESSFAQQELLSFEGDELKIAFNSRFVLDFLNTVSSKEIRIELTTPISPVVFKRDTDEHYLHIIMPLRTEEIEG